MQAAASISTTLLGGLANNQILGGILSSACFAAISGVYILVMRRMRNAALRALIPSSDSGVVVVCPSQALGTSRNDSGMMSTEEAMALAEVLQCAAALNKTPLVLSCAERTRHSGVVSLGGMNNSFTAANLSEFCPGLAVRTSSADCGETLISHGTTQIAPPTDQKSVAFIIFLSSTVTGCKDPVLMIFGQFGIDTCAAAHYLRTSASRLYREFRGRAFAVKLVTHPVLGNQGFPASYEDISADVFGTLSRPSGSRLRRHIPSPLRNASPSRKAAGHRSGAGRDPAVPRASPAGAALCRAKTRA